MMMRGEAKHGGGGLEGGRGQNDKAKVQFSSGNVRRIEKVIGRGGGREKVYMGGVEKSI